MVKPQYLRWLIAEEGITFSDGIPIACYRLEYNTDEDIFIFRVKFCIATPLGCIFLPKML